MAAPEVIHKSIYQGQALPILSDVRNPSGSLATQDSIHSIALKVWDRDNPSQTTYDEELTVADVIYDEAQNDSRWPYRDGYNFSHVIPGSAFPDGDKTYRIEMQGVDSDGFKLPVSRLIDATTIPLLGE